MSIELSSKYSTVALELNELNMLLLYEILIFLYSNAKAALLKGSLSTNLVSWAGWVSNVARTSVF
jgi:hypothetical protein